MAELFDPYTVWLNIAAEARPPNFFQLLGLEDTENDSQAIAVAADRMLARLRSVRPGPQATTWARLLDELSQAKACLLDPARRAAYEAELRNNRASTVPSPLQGRVRLANATSGDADLFPPDMLLPPGVLLPPGGAQPAIERTLANDGPSDPMAPIENFSPFVAAAIASGEAGEQTFDAANNLEEAAESADYETQQHEPAFAAQQGADGVGLHANLKFGEQSGRRSKTTAETLEALLDPRASQRLLVMCVAGGMVLSLFAMVLIFLTGDRDPELKPLHQMVRIPPKSQSPELETPLTRSGEKRGQKTNASQPGTTAFRPTSAAAKTASSRSKISSTGATPEGGATNDSAGTPAKLLSTPATARAGQVSESFTDQGGSGPGDHAVDRSLQMARKSLADRDLDKAKGELDAAAKRASSATQRAQISQMRSLHGYVASFWNSVRQSLKSLQAVDELKIGGEMMAVVDATSDSLLIRYRGANRRYSLFELPTPLALHLAERWLDSKATSTHVFLGAFLAVDPQGDIPRARRLWEEASLAGAPVGDLLRLLDQPAPPAGQPE